MNSFNFTFFTPGHNVLLQALHLRVGLGAAQLGVAAILLAAALGYCAYTDALCGRVIRNTVVGAIALAAGASAPLIFADTRSHFLWAAVMIALVGLLYLARVVKEGDLKLFAALALVFAQGTAVLVLAAFAVIAVYGLPQAVLLHWRARSQGRKHGLTQVPAAPGIALGYPLTLLLAGVSAGDCLLLVIVELLAFTLSLFCADLLRRSASAVEALDGVDGVDDIDNATRVAPVDASVDNADVDAESEGDEVVADGLTRLG